jgi:hypothetical protein
MEGIFGESSEIIRAGPVRPVGHGVAFVEVHLFQEQENEV